MEKSRRSIIKEGGVITHSMGKDCTALQMGATTKANGRTTKRTGVGFIATAMETATRVNL